LRRSGRRSRRSPAKRRGHDRRSAAAFETEFEDGVKVSDLADLDVDAFINFVIDDCGLSTETLVAAAFDAWGSERG